MQTNAPVQCKEQIVYACSKSVDEHTQYSLYLSLSLIYIYIYGLIVKYFILNLHDMYGHELKHMVRVPYN